MSEKSESLLNELTAVCIAFGRQVELDWQALTGNARDELKAYVDALERLIDQTFGVGSDLIYPDGVFDDDKTAIESHWHALVEAWKRCKRWGK